MKTNTPTPWTIDQTTGVNFKPVYLLESENGDSIGRVDTSADAALIVTAVNSHEELKAYILRAVRCDCIDDMECERCQVLNRAEGRI